jgi:hypothetical protein
MGTAIILVGVFIYLVVLTVRALPTDPETPIDQSKRS